MWKIRLFFHFDDRPKADKLKKTLRIFKREREEETKRGMEEIIS
jgi:hypothetical protein